MFDEAGLHDVDPFDSGHACGIYNLKLS
jgi:hypothetical protein